MSVPDCETQLATLERLLAISTATLDLALVRACNEIAGSIGADKVDAFLYDAERDTLSAIGSSTQELSRLQRNHGLDQLALANGGRSVEVFRTGESFIDGRVDEDREELRGIRDVLRIRSTIGVPLDVGGKRRGVLMLASLKRDRWVEGHLRFAEAIARWVGMLAHRAELVEEIERNAAAQGRQVAAEELITTLAHDLRNLINPIDVRLQLMQRRAESEHRARDATDAEKGRKSLDRLSTMITEILDVARIGRGSFEIEPRAADLTAIVRDVAATLGTPQQRVICTTEDAIVIVVDVARIRQCLENIVANALKHSPRNADVNILVHRKVDADIERAIIDVIDEGPGVAPEVVRHLFERFVSGGRKGLGIGLFLARQIALAHGGDVTLESGTAKGARFRVTLPIG